MPSRSPGERDIVALASINGRVVPVERATLPIEDWGVRFGWGLFETIRIHSGVALFLDRHLTRLTTAGRDLALDTGDVSRWRVEIHRVVTPSGIREGALNLYVTRGHAPGFAPVRVIVARPQQSPRKRTCRLWVAPWRVDPTAPTVGRKTLAYLPNVLASEAAFNQGYDDAVLVNNRGRIADAARASVFIIRDGILKTPSLRDGALPGVTRQLILEAAELLEIPVQAGGIPLSSLSSADAVFLSSSLRGLRLATHLVERPLRATKRAGIMLDTLRGAYRRLIRNELRRAGV